jgi:hypothetical protein
MLFIVGSPLEILYTRLKEKGLCSPNHPPEDSKTLWTISRRDLRQGGIVISNYESGEIVLVEFPFTSGESVKRRPAIAPAVATTFRTLGFFTVFAT